MKPRILEVRQKILKKNDELARELRSQFREDGMLTVNLVSSPGTGKTALLQRTLGELQSRGLRVAALVGDLATDNDARKLAASGAPVRQITTDGCCHLEADMIAKHWQYWALAPCEMLFIENVGNLVCPASYDLGDLLSFKGIAEGVDNTNYIVHTGRGPYILTLYEKRVSRDDLPFFLGLMEHLASRGVSCPTPVRDLEGRNLRELAGRAAALVTFLEGFWVRRPTPVHCAAVGRALAQMHLGGEGFALKRANALGLAGWRPLYERFANRTDEISARPKKRSSCSTRNRSTKRSSGNTMSS